MSQHNFGRASEDDPVVFGASRPAYPCKQVVAPQVEEWLQFMSDQQIRRVVCLLDSQLSFYDPVPGGLLTRYQEFFGSSNVLHAPVEDYRLTTDENLNTILRFLDDSAAAAERVVVHCSSGSGRTGHVLAAWLVHSGGLDPEDALQTVQVVGETGASRDPCEAVHTRHATKQELVDLLRGDE